VLERGKSDHDNRLGQRESTATVFLRNSSAQNQRFYPWMFLHCHGNTRSAFPYTFGITVVQDLVPICGRYRTKLECYLSHFFRQ
jgi:hypothetical protein